jgi:putative RNA 2'-phosphotransferase
VDVDLDLPTDQVPDHLYFPATDGEVPVLLEVGLKPTDRRKVHLSKTAGDAHAAGRVRTPAPVLLEIDAKGMRSDGLVILRAARTVFLAGEVPPKYLRKLEPEEMPSGDYSTSALDS